jgi:4-amino-4-deoxy-L-arabinose transferase-like glycosyltransferase
MRRSVIAVALALLAVALLLPSQATAEVLTGAGSPLSASVAEGVSILRTMLAVHAVLLLIAGRLAPRAGTFEPLVERGIEPPARLDPRSAWTVGALLALALILRVRGLDLGISFDEIDTLVHYARKPLAVIVTTFDSQNQHLLYSVLARFSCAVFGDGTTSAGTFAVRMPAVLLGVASIWALYRFALLVTDRREALFAAALLTVSYHHVWFSQNARGYSGLLLFALLGSEAFLAMLREREPRGFGAPLRYGIWMALATLIHATAVIVVAAHGVIWLALLWTSRKRAVGANRWQPGLGFVFAASLSLLFYALVLPQFFDTLLAPTSGGKAIEWKQPSWLASEMIAGLARGVPGGIAVLAAGAAVALVGAVSYARQSLVVLATFVLGGVLMALALIGTHHNLWPRMFFFAAGFAVLIALRGVTTAMRTLPERFAPRATAAAMVLLCLGSAASLARVWAPKQDYEGAMHFLDQQLVAAPSDAVVTVDMTAMPYAEYYGRTWPSVDNVAALQSIEALHPRTWIVYTTPTRMQSEYPELWARLQSEYTVERTFWGTLGGSEVVVAASKSK